MFFGKEILINHTFNRFRVKALVNFYMLRGSHFGMSRTRVMKLQGIFRDGKVVCEFYKSGWAAHHSIRVLTDKEYERARDVEGFDTEGYLRYPHLSYSFFDKGKTIKMMVFVGKDRFFGV